MPAVSAMNHRYSGYLRIASGSVLLAIHLWIFALLRCGVDPQDMLSVRLWIFALLRCGVDPQDMRGGRT
jgi:hypothetical protein